MPVSTHTHSAGLGVSHRPQLSGFHEEVHGPFLEIWKLETAGCHSPLEGRILEDGTEVAMGHLNTVGHWDTDKLPVFVQRSHTVVYGVVSNLP